MFDFTHQAVDSYVERIAPVGGKHGVFSDLQILDRRECDVSACNQIPLNKRRLGSVVMLWDLCRGGISDILFFGYTRLLSAGFDFVYAVDYHSHNNDDDCENTYADTYPCAFGECEKTQHNFYLLVLFKHFFVEM